MVVVRLLMRLRTPGGIQSCGNSGKTGNVRGGVTNSKLVPGRQVDFKLLSQTTRNAFTPGGRATYYSDGL